MNRRSFFTRIAKAVTIAVVAPVILREVITARLPTVDSWWYQTTRMSRCVDAEYEAEYRRLFDSNPSFQDFKP